MKNFIDTVYDDNLAISYALVMVGRFLYEDNGLGGYLIRGKLPGDIVWRDMFLRGYWPTGILPRGILTGGYCRGDIGQEIRFYLS